MGAIESLRSAVGAAFRKKPENPMAGQGVPPEAPPLRERRQRVLSERDQLYLRAAKKWINREFLKPGELKSFVESNGLTTEELVRAMQTNRDFKAELEEIPDFNYSQFANTLPDLPTIGNPQKRAV